MNEIYLDNAATTACDKEVAALMSRILCEDYGNPSSLHHMGVVAEGHLRTAKEQLAAAIKCKPEEILFTSGGTEADNLALFGAARAYERSGRHIISTAMEHPAVGEALKQLEAEGFAVTRILPDATGHIAVQDVLDAVREDTILVSVMLVNNEVGSVQPVEDIGTALKAQYPKVLLHTDAVQGFGKLLVSVKKMQTDLLSISGHKIHGPKGSGCLYVRKGVRLQPVVYGGGQQNNLRPGTENVAAYAGLGLAAERATASMEEDAARMRALRKDFMKAVLSAIDGITFLGDNSTDSDSTMVPHILSMAVEGVRAEVLLHALEDKGIYISSGSACSSNHPQPSATLQAMGVRQEMIETTVRLSLSKYTEEEDMAGVLSALKELVPVLRRYRRS